MHGRDGQDVGLTSRRSWVRTPLHPFRQYNGQNAAVAQWTGAGLLIQKTRVRIPSAAYQDMQYFRMKYLHVLFHIYPLARFYFFIYNPLILRKRKFLPRGRAAAAREAHNLEDGGSNPSPATFLIKTPPLWRRFVFFGTSAFPSGLFYFFILILRGVSDFFRQGSSVGQSIGLINLRSRVQLPPLTHQEGPAPSIEWQGLLRLIAFPARPDYRGLTGNDT